MNEKKFCKDCKHFREGGYQLNADQLYSCKLFTKTNLVTGKVSYLECETARGTFVTRSIGYEGPTGQTITCGDIGRYYEAM